MAAQAIGISSRPGSMTSRRRKCVKPSPQIYLLLILRHVVLQAHYAFVALQVSSSDAGYYALAKPAFRLQKTMAAVSRNAHILNF